jgi:predicted ATPase/DNA-binding SARP family transcriptional activator
MTGPSARFGLLGPLAVAIDGEPVPLGGRKQRALLGALLLERNRPVSVDRLIDAVWGEAAPDTARNTVQVYVSQLRKLLPEGALETVPPGYRLVAAPDAIDLFEFARLAEDGRSALAAGDAARAAETLRTAFELWRGPPLPDLDGVDAVAEVARLEELRLAATEDFVDAELALGRHRRLAGELERLVAEHPLRERLRAQLMLALYRSGRQADALAVYQRARRTLLDELGLEPGESLRQLERAILAQDRSLDLPAPAAASPRRIPSPPTPLLGRERELAALLDLARRDEIRLVTLTGIGGIGKTRLALELVHRLAPEFRDGAAVALLASLDDEALVARAILEALELPETGLDAETTVVAALADAHLLLLVDNFEQVLGAAPLVARLVEAAPQLTVVATSRAPLRVRAEHEFVVPPLAEDEAAELFVARAHAVDPAFALTEENAGAVAELCERLDGLALAIELAAARTKLLSPAALLARLGNRLELLTGGSRDAPRHQQTLRTTLDWSYDLLDSGTQRLFRQLAVFAGGWTLDSAEAVCATAAPVLDGLAALVDESLVGRREVDGMPRFAMLGLVRDYALERLAASQEADETRRRLVEHVVALADDAEPGLAGSEQAAWLARIEAEHDNVRAALAYALDAGETEGALRLVVGVRRFWQIHGYLAEGRESLEAALAASEGSPSELRAKALNMLGILAGEQGDFDAARLSFTSAAGEARATGATRALSSALVNLGNLAFFSGDVDTARALYTESIEHFASVGDLRGQARAKENIGLLSLTADDAADAVGWLTEARDLAREVGDELEVGGATRSLAAAMIELGQTVDATALLVESLGIARRLGDAHGVAVCLETFAGLAAATGDAARAATLFGASDAARAAIGARRQPDHEILYERWLARTLAQLDTNKYAKRYEDGRLLTLEDAAALALAPTAAFAS